MANDVDVDDDDDDVDDDDTPLVTLNEPYYNIGKIGNLRPVCLHLSSRTKAHIYIFITTIRFS